MWRRFLLQITICKYLITNSANNPGTRVRLDDLVSEKKAEKLHGVSHNRKGCHLRMIVN